MSTKTIAITDETIAKLEAVGFNRWTKGRYDRLYINPKTLGMKVKYYKTGNVSSAEWGELDKYNTKEYVEYPRSRALSNSEARRILFGKYFIDLTDGTLNVDSGADYADCIYALIAERIDKTISC